MNEAVMKKAEELAKAIAGSEEYICMRMAEEAAMSDPQMTKIASEYYTTHQKLEEITADEHPDFESMGKLTEELNTLRDQMNALPLASVMQDARKEFTNMMDMVNYELKKLLTGEKDGNTCTGNCSGCHGCGH